MVLVAHRPGARFLRLFGLRDRAGGDGAPILLRQLMHLRPDGARFGSKLSVERIAPSINALRPRTTRAIRVFQGRPTGTRCVTSLSATVSQTRSTESLYALWPRRIRPGLVHDQVTDRVRRRLSPVGS